MKHEEAKDLRRDPGVKHAVITTWQISIEQIRRTRPAAIDFLALMSMFDRQGIPEDLLYDNTNRLQFEDAVEPLTSLSLVGMQTEQQIETHLFEMHRLVQLSTKKWLELNEQLEKWRKESVRKVAVTFPSGQYETWAACQLLLPHSKMVLSYLANNEDKDEVLNRSMIAKNTARYLFHRGEYAAADNIGQIGLEGREKMLRREHIDTLSSMNNLGVILENLGKYEEAEAMHGRCVEAMEKSLGPEHPDTLFSVSNLSFILGHLGKYKEAKAGHR